MIKTDSSTNLDAKALGCPTKSHLFLAFSKIIDCLTSLAYWIEILWLICCQEYLKQFLSVHMPIYTSVIQSRTETNLEIFSLCFDFDHFQVWKTAKMILKNDHVPQSCTDVHHSPTYDECQTQSATDFHGHFYIVMLCSKLTRAPSHS